MCGRAYSELWSPYYDKRERVIWEMRHEEATLYIINQYEVVENRLELKAILIKDYGSGYLRYTEKRMVEGAYEKKSQRRKTP